jgi:glycosyltransferase involved in cell wall biosynthesis
MRNPKVLYLMNSIGPTSIPLEIAEHIDEERFDVVVLSYYNCGEYLEPEMADSGVRIIAIGAQGKADIGAIFRLYRTMKRIAPDILHTHHNLSGSLGRVFAKCLRVPVIVDTEHSVPSEDLRYTSGAALLNGLTLGLADAVVFNSSATQASLPKWISRLVKPEKKRVIYNGVDIARIESNQGKGLPAECPISEWVSKKQSVICNVGSLRPVKNQTALIAALESIRSEAHDAKLVIVGGGPLEEELRKEIAQRNLNSDVWLAGEVSRDTVYRILNACDVFVMTSLWEGFCVAVAEAMTAGKPVITTKVGGIPEVVGTVGRYVGPHNLDELARAILEFRDNPKRANTLGEAGRRRVEEHFSLKRCVRNYENLYTKLLERKTQKRE